MGEVISFRAGEEMEEEIRREIEDDPGDPSRSAVTKRLVREAVEARNTPLWVRIGMSDRRAAQIEALRRQGENDGDVARELLAEAIERRHGDVLDELDASPELREAVEAHTEEGETLRDTTVRLLRVGVDAADLDAYTVRLRLVASLLAYTGVVIAGTALTGWRTVAIATALTAAAAVVYSRYRPLSTLPTRG